MNRKHQLNKLEELSGFIESVASHIEKFSQDPQDTDVRQARLTKLQTAVSQLKKKLAKSSPFSADPVPGFNSLCEKIRANTTKEYIIAMRLSHKKFMALQADVLAYEQGLRDQGYPVDLESEKNQLESLIMAFKRLGSRKLYEQDFSHVRKAIDACETARAKTESMFNKADQAVNAILSTTEG